MRPAVLPYAALTRLVPPLQWGGVPSRFHGITLLCLIYPAAVGLTWLGRRGALAAALALAETAPAPFPMVALPRFPALEALEALPPGAAVVDATGDEYRMLFRQTIHGRPMAGGHVSRVPEPADRFIRETPWLTFLLAGGPPPAGDGAAELRRLGFGAVIVEEDEGLDREAVRATWRRRGFEELTGAVLDALSVVRRQTAEELRAELAERRPEPAARVPRDLLEWTVAESNRRLVRDHLERTLGWRPAAIDSLVCVYRLP